MARRRFFLDNPGVSVLYIIGNKRGDFWLSF
jgi:hypothetical protein